MGCSNTKEPRVSGNKIADVNTYIPTENGVETHKMSPPEKRSRSAKGDLIQRKDAKKDRLKRLKEKRNKDVQRAQVISDLIMDERERLSFTSSRAGSRATSRTGTPGGDRKKLSMFPLTVENGSLPPSEADEDLEIANQSSTNGGTVYNTKEDQSISRQHSTVSRKKNGVIRTNNNNNSNDSDKEESVESFSKVRLESKDSNDKGSEEKS